MHHFAFLRAVAQGLSALDAARRYLSVDTATEANREFPHLRGDRALYVENHIQIKLIATAEEAVVIDEFQKLVEQLRVK